MVQLAQLTASLELQSAQFLSGLRESTAATNRSAAAIERGMSRASTAIKGFVGVFAATKLVDGAREYLEMADASKKMEAQLKLATAQFGNQGVAMRQTREIAKETNSGLAETVSLYSKFLPAARDLGKGQDDAARATETFSKALKIGGADTNAAASATMQFGQALASGVLRGDEFNSVNEASPRIMRLLAESMEQPVGALRKMAEEGKLTSDVLFKALTDPKFTKSIDEEFAELPKTFEQAKTAAMNAVTDIVGAFERGSGISSAIVGAMGEGTDSVDDLARSAEAAGADMRANFEGLYNVFQPLLAGGNSVFDLLGIRVVSLRDQIRSILGQLDAARNFLPDLQRKAQQWDEKWLGRRTGYTGDLGPRSDMAGDFDRGYDASRRKSARSRLINNIRVRGSDKDFTGKGMTDQQLIDRAAKLTGDIQGGRAGRGTVGSGRAVPRPTSGDKKGGSGKSAAEKAQKEAERAAEKKRRDEEAFYAELDRYQERELDSRLAMTETAETRFQNERAALERENASNLRSIDKDGPQGSKRYSAEQVQQLKTLANKTTAQKQELTRLEEAQFLADADVKVRTASLGDAMDVARLQQDMARTANQRKEAELRILDLQYEQEKLALEATIASRDSTEAEKRIAQARLDLLPQIKAGQAAGIERQNMGPMAQYLDTIPRAADEINEALQRVQVDGLQGVEDGLLDAIRGVGSLGDAFSNMADQIVKDLLRIAIQQMVVKPLGNALFGGGGGGGGGGLFGSLLKGVVGIAAGGATGNWGSGITAGLAPVSSGLSLDVVPRIGARANGGMTRPGSYLVGERGPEVVDIGRNANVLPNHRLDAVRGSGGGVNVTFGSITSNDPDAVKVMATEAIMQMAPMLTQNAVNATVQKLNRPRI